MREHAERRPAYLAWLREQACLVPGCGASPCEAAHVRRGTDGGMGRKPSDRWSVPLCTQHHRQQHAMGEASFEARHGILLRPSAEALFESWSVECQPMR